MNGRHNGVAKTGTEVALPPKSVRGREKARRGGVAVEGVNGHCVAGSVAIGKHKSAQPREVGEEDMEAARAALLAEKEMQMKRTFDKHDNMVRELYHMDHFRLMITYDPQEAKADNTPSFKQYKAPYDLLEKVEALAGPSRRTRGTRSEQLSLVSKLSLSSSPMSSKPARAQKGKLMNPTIHSIISPSRFGTQGKEKKSKPGKLKDAEEVGRGRSPKPSPNKLDGSEGRRAVLSTIEVDQAICPTTVTPVSVPLTRRNRSKTLTSARSLSAIDKSSHKGGAAARKNGLESISAVLGRRSSRLREDVEGPPAKRIKAAAGEELEAQLSPPKSPTLPPISIAKPPKPPELDTLAKPEDKGTAPALRIKRIRLLVRRPPPTLSHHKQRPPLPKFNSSLNNFLNSYKSLGDRDVDDETIAKRALEEARIREQEALFCRQGRFIPGTDTLFGSEPNTVPYIPPKRTTRDAWDDIVEIISVVRSKIPKKTLGQQVTAQIASKVQAYWDSQEVKKDRARAQEDKRLKALAKATVKMVVVEWKKVVHHVREQERLRLEAEERRRGHEHLDAILDQSGQLLETQQGDLRRAQSRSSSMDVSHGGWGDDEEEEEEEEDLVEDDDDDVSEEENGMSELVSEKGTGLLSLRESETPVDGPSKADIDGRVEREEEEEEEGEALPEEEEEEEEEEADEEGEEGGEEEDGEEDRSNQSAALLFDPPRELDTSGLGTTSELGVDLEDTNLDVVQDADNEDQVLAGGSPSQSPAPSPEVSIQSHHSSPRSIPKETEGAPIAEKGSLSMEGVIEDDQGDAVSGILPLEQDTTGVEDSAPGNEITEEGQDIQREEEAIADEKTMAEAEGQEEEEEADISDSQFPEYLRPFAVAHVEWNPEEKVKSPLLLRGVLRPYQQSGLEWLASLHLNNLNGILADEMGLGKTIQTISLLAHLACDRGIWGPHLIIVPTSVLLNWEMEFKKFLPGFKVLSYHGTTKRRKELRQGWNDKYHFNVCITSYTLASRDAHIFKRKPWYYMVLDEAHMIKNFKSQRWNLLLMFRSFRRLLLTGTPLQNNLTELWALLQFLMSGSNFANLKEFGEWFSNPLEKAIEMGSVLDDDTMQRVSKLHTVLRPYLLRRLKRDVEKELPSKFEHLVLCPLSKRQRFLYDEFMSRAQTRDDLESGVYQKIANILMQLRKVCNHPDLFEVRPIVTSFAMPRSAIADFEITELMIRKRWLEEEGEKVNLDFLGYRFVDRQDEPLLTAVETRRLSTTSQLAYIHDLPGEPPPKDTRTIAGYRRYKAYKREADIASRGWHFFYLNQIRCSQEPIYSSETLSTVRRMLSPLLPFSALDLRQNFMDVVQPLHKAVLSYTERAESMVNEINKFAFVTPPVVALDLPRLASKGGEDQIAMQPLAFDQILHPASVKLQIAFPDPSLLQYDCGKLQELKRLLQEKKAGGHRVLIFTQMTRILDILEIFLNLHGYLYLRLDGATKIEDRQYITERFNADARVFCFIASSRSGGVGINLTGADTVVFYDSDFNPQMDKQCEDRAHRIGQIRDVHIYRFVSQHTVEEAMLRKANQKRSLDDIVIQKGEFDWRTIFNDDEHEESVNGRAAVTALTKALGEFEDVEDARAAAVAAREEFVMEGADNADFGFETGEGAAGGKYRSTAAVGESAAAGEEGPTGGQIVADDIGQPELDTPEIGGDDEEQEEEDEGGTVVDYMLAFVQREYDFFKDWRL